MTRSEAETILRQFICVGSTNTVDTAMIREAVAIVVDQSDYQIFGVCADTVEIGARSLAQYLTAIGYDNALVIRPIARSVYIKYNPNTDRVHVEPYTGEHRGVLLSCQSDDDRGVNETFGHLPLDLFEQQ